MCRPAFLTVALFQLLATPLCAQPAVDKDLSDSALVLTVAYDNLGRGTDSKAVRDLLATTKESLRGTPHRLLERLSAEPDGKQAILGKAVPKPENLFRLAVLHPSEPKVVFVCDQGAVFLDDDKCLLSTAADGTLTFWHIPSGTQLLRMKIAESIYQPSCHVNGSTILWNQRSGPRYFSFK